MKRRSNSILSSDVSESAGLHLPKVNLTTAAKKVANSEQVFSGIFIRAYQVTKLRKLVLRTILKLEGGLIFSRSFRRILKDYHDVEIGDFSYGRCLYPAGYLKFFRTGLPAGTRVGRYCSFGRDVAVFRRNHPVERLTQHPLFYNSALGIVEKDTINQDADNPLEIGHDVWIGERSIILPSCKAIGNGAIVGAGSVVTRDIAPYSIVVGTPARHLKYRFNEELIQQIESSNWWDLAPHQLLKFGPLLYDAVDQISIQRCFNSPQ